MSTNRTRRINLAVMALAYGHRYVFPVLIPGCSIHFGTKETVMLLLGIGLLIYAAYSLAGYLLRWKHIFCSYQNAYQKNDPRPHQVEYRQKIRRLRHPAYFCSPRHTLYRLLSFLRLNPTLLFLSGGSNES